MLLMAGCIKDKEITYSIEVSKPNTHTAVLEIDDATYNFSETSYRQEVTLKEFDVVDISLDYLAVQSEKMSLTVKDEDNNIIASVSDNSYMWIILSQNSITSSGNYSTGSSSGGGSSTSGSHLCGAPTKDGTPCQRRVSGSSGYCWQHD